MRYKSLRTRLIFILLLMGIIPVLTSVTYNFISTEATFQELQLEEQQQLEQAAATQIQQMTDKITHIAEIYSQEEGVQRLAQTKDRAELNRLGEALFNKVAAEHGLTHFEIGDAQGVVQFRGHNLEKFGDDKSELKAIQQALQGEVLSGFEYGASGLALRAFVPIKEHNQVIGTLQVGVGDEFLSAFQQLFPTIQLHLVNDANEITLSSEPKKIGELVTSDVLGQVSTGEVQRVTNKENRTIESYIPMMDPTNTSRVSTLLLVQNIEVMQAMMYKMLMMSIVILFITIICATIVAYVYSRTLTKPIRQTANDLHILRSGDLTKRIETHRRQDEIGQLMTDMKGLQETLHQTISGVVHASQVVSEESGVLAQSTQEVSSGAEEVAETMEILSRGVEKQTAEITQVGDVMTEFTQNLCETTTKGRQLAVISEQVHQLTVDGKQLMVSSNEQMQQMQQQMTVSMNKMMDLEQKVREITTFVSVIHEVANQTNLLALNASIEAARAGEHGKGFAVVADEVRKLAEQVNHSVQEIETIVTAVQSSTTEVNAALANGSSQMAHGVEQFVQTTATFVDIDDAVIALAQFLKQVMTQLEEMTEEGQQIHASVQEITAITQETAASVEETTATVVQTSATMGDVASASEHLSELAEQLNTVVKTYKIE